MSVFSLNKDVATSSTVAEEDMIPLKTYLKKFGVYDTPSYGMTRYPDNELFEGIKMYQRKNNLTVDGTMKRGGETICSMNKELSRSKPSRLEFNGKELSWYEDDNKVASWKGMSGKPDYQCKEYDVIKNKGPLPEGLGWRYENKINYTIMVLIDLLLVIAPSIYALRKLKTNKKRAYLAVMIPFFIYLGRFIYYNYFFNI